MRIHRVAWISGSPVPPRQFSNSSGLSEVEIDFDIEGDVHWGAVSHSGPELPFLQGLNRVLVESESQAANNSKDVDCAVPPHDGFEDDSALVSRLACFFGVLWIHLEQDRRR